MSGSLLSRVANSYIQACETYYKKYLVKGAVGGLIGGGILGAFEPFPNRSPGSYALYGAVFGCAGPLMPVYVVGLGLGAGVWININKIDKWSNTICVPKKHKK